MRLPGSRVIIIGPPDLARAWARAAECDAVACRSFEDLDRWREQQRCADDTVGPDLNTALQELETSLDELPLKLRVFLKEIAVEKNVPALRDLEHRWSSRRSFYRMWNESVDEPPSTFLRLFRSLHIVRLLSVRLSKH